MKDNPERPDGRGWGARVKWLVVIWSLSVGALAVVAASLKALMKLVGMSS